MSRYNRFRRSEESSSARQPEQQGQAASNGNGEQPPAASVITLHLGGRNPFRCYNAYLITGSKHVLVDPGPPGSAGELLEQLSRHRISLGEIGLIVLTHGHPDHFGSASQFKEWTRAPLAVHELDAEYVNFGSVPVLKPATRLGTLFKSLFAVKSDPVEPDIILHDGDKLGRYAGRGRVIQTPGHTAGSISILLPDGNCIVGDLVMRGLSSRMPSPPWFAENAAEARESLQKIVNAGARTILPGHGGPFDVQQLARRFPWLTVPERQTTDEGAAPSARSSGEEVRATGEVSRTVPEGSRAPEEGHRFGVDGSRSRFDGPRSSGEGQRTSAEGPGNGVEAGDRPRRRRPRHRRPQGRDGSAGQQAPGSSSEH
ncbi:MAG: MBL fold metallo-hydrolase [Dehalococcoidia bacterium]|nr:MBL fold metallo-hydrolase [Dehalococcoidia bacterium]